MIFYQKTKEDVEHGPKTLLLAADKAENDRDIIAEEDITIFPSNPGEMNASTIQSKLIEITGRFCERYASDLICTFADLQPFIVPSVPDHPDRWIIGVGIRDSGVDHNAFIMARLKETQSAPFHYVHPSMKYRKILALDIVENIDESGYFVRTIKLKDIGSHIIKIDEADIEKSA